MRLTTRSAALLVLFALWGNSAFAMNPALSLDQNIVRTWGVDQGLPQGTVYALAQTADGYVWAATQEGFVRFDGTEFVTYDKAADPQIHNNMTLALLSARDGSLIAGDRNPWPLASRSQYDAGSGAGMAARIQMARLGAAPHFHSRIRLLVSDDEHMTGILPVDLPVAAEGGWSVCSAKRQLLK